MEGDTHRLNSSSHLHTYVYSLLSFSLFPLPFSRDTYNHLVSWLADARMLARPDITVVVVGNQMDRKDEREVTLLEASRFAQENGEYTTMKLDTQEGKNADALERWQNRGYDSDLLLTLFYPLIVTDSLFSLCCFLRFIVHGDLCLDW